MVERTDGRRYLGLDVWLQVDGAPCGLVRSNSRNGSGDVREHDRFSRGDGVDGPESDCLSGACSASPTARVGSRWIQQPETADAIRARPGRKGRRDPMGRSSRLAAVGALQQQNPLGLPTTIRSRLQPSDQRPEAARQCPRRSAGAPHSDRRTWSIDHQPPRSGMLAAKTSMVTPQRHT